MSADDEIIFSLLLLTTGTRLVVGTGDVDLLATNTEEDEDFPLAIRTGPDKDIRLLFKGRGEDDISFRWQSSR